MRIKQFKDIEQFIKNEADGYEPPFEEEAWIKMEALLDKDKDRKKPFFWLWWLLPLMLAGSVGGYLIFNTNTGRNNAGNKVAEKSGRTVLPAVQNDKVFIPGTANPSPGVIAPGSSINSITGVDIQTTRDQQFSPGGKSSVSKNILQNGRPVDGIENVLANSSKISDNINSNMKLKVSSNIATSDAEQQPVNKNDFIKNKASDDKPIKNIPVETQQMNKSEPLKSRGNEKNISGPENKITPKQKIAKPNSSRFYFIAAAGAEGSGVKLLSAHSISATGGLAIGYQLSKNFSIQTGFFAGNKKYLAGPGDYNPKAGTYWSTVDIIRVDANCMVYEFPLNARYDFNPGDALNFFAVTGISSYLMKKEGYQYVYNRYGYPHNGKADYKGNKHLFSVLRLSAGIEKSISKTISFHAAPAISIPFGGVGEGRVKLYSSEVMLGLRYQPLKKIK